MCQALCHRLGIHRKAGETLSRHGALDSKTQGGGWAGPPPPPPPPPPRPEADAVGVVTATWGEAGVLREHKRRPVT